MIGIAQTISRTSSRAPRRLSAKINLIPYNTVEGLEWSRPSRARQEKFQSILRGIFSASGKKTPTPARRVYARFESCFFWETNKYRKNRNINHQRVSVFPYFVFFPFSFSPPRHSSLFSLFVREMR